MKKIIIALFFLLPFLMFSQKQQGKIAEKTQSLLVKPGKFKSFDIFKSGYQQAKNNYSDAVEDGVIVSFDQSKVAAIYSEDPQQMELTIPFKSNGETIRLELYQKDIFSPDFKAMTSDGRDITNIMDRGKHYRGIVSGNSQSLVSISIFRNEVIGFLSFGDGNYTIGKLKDSESNHIIYKDNELLQQQEFNCSTEDDGISYSTEDLTYTANRDPGDCVNVYVEAGQSVFNSFGGNLALTTNFLNGVFGQSYVLYANEGITMQTSSMLIWTTPDPYTGPDTSTQLGTFQALTGAFAGDIGHLVEVQNIGGLAAGFNGICNPVTDNSLCFSGFSGNSFSNVPTVSFNVYIITHEMGHLLGSRHTHACVWNGNNTAIDTCSGFTEGACPLVGSPPGGGTIMSYCINDPVGLDFTQGFGPQPSAVINNTVNAPGNCLVGCNIQPNDLCTDAININYGDTLSGSTTGASWDSVTPCIDELGGSNTAPGVWYSFTGDGNMSTLSTCNQANYDTKISVFTGSCAALACEIAVDDAPGCAGFTTQLDFCTTNGTTYNVLVHGFSSDTGDFDLTLSSNPIGPAISCPAPIIQDNDPGECGAIVNYIAPIGTDDCPGVTTIQTEGLASGATFPVGTTTNTFVTTDAAGLTDTCSFDVTINDIEAPIALCQNITIELDATGNVSILDSDLDDGSTDNCPGMIAGSPYDEFLRYLDPNTYVSVSPDISITVGGNPVNGINGMDRSPIDDLIYIVVKPSGGGRKLATLDPLTGIATTIGSNFPENFAGITFTTAGVLYGITGDGSSTSETLFTIDTTTAAITQILSLGNGSDGEAIAFNPDDGLIYHWSGRDIDFAFESIDPNTLVVTPIAISGFATDEVFGAQYNGSGEFIITNLDMEMVTMSTTGVSTLIGPAVYYFKGLEFNSSPPLTFSASQTDFTCADVGDNSITLTVTDGSSNSSICMAIVTVEDNLFPTWTNPPSDMSVECDGTSDPNGDFAAWLVSFTGTDNCPNPVVTHNSIGLSDDCGATGSETVTFTLTDASGNAITLDATFTIEDTIPPVIGCPGDVIAIAELGSCGAIVIFQPAVGLDDCGSVFVYQSGGLGSGSVFPVGDTIIEYTAIDDCDNMSTCTFIVTVEDDELPIANCNNLIIQLDEFGDASITADDVDAVSTDNCGVDFISIDIDTFDCSDVGDNNVTLTVTDVNGNESTCVAIVTVEDVTAPEVFCQDITIELDADGVATITGLDIDAGSSDACGIDNYELSMDSFDCNYVGNNTVTLYVTDVNGNMSSCTATVTVEDNIAPELVCMDVTIELGEDGITYISPSDLVVSVEDACGVVVLTADLTEVSCADIGTPIEVNIFAIDNNGNPSFCSLEVTVVDTLGPDITCPPNEVVIVEPNGTHTLGDYIADGIATVTDNCTDPVTIFSQDPAAGTVLGYGVHNITFSAEDEYGNVSTCSFELNIQELLGANDNLDLGSLVLYPNPANNYVNLNNPNQLELIEMVIYDLTGRIINRVDLTNMGIDKTIDVSNLANATYMVLIKGAQGVSTKQLIVGN